ncbi:zinc metalloprotease [Streptomyces abyssalis]|uniref:Aminopeptidase N n=1 Tax=Streptomyces abyssalis TaxID=933944 RepID=A0A1E7JHN7_9ACTN|nr:M1 family metallopeptidase [Streptomyces abyssalis]OEU85996.1 zinc metalloprotease [Streptomyces abyssalis]OEU93230.1 zinc metalloprotease [Streptomyces abyssalis]
MKRPAHTPRVRFRNHNRARARTSAAVACAVLALVGAGLPSPKPLGVGDRLFPHLGNPGYDVRAYDISFRYEGNTEPLEARTVIEADVTARDGLPRFNLDFASGKVRSVSVAGRGARFEQAGEDLVVTPPESVRKGERMRVVVRHTSPTQGVANGGWVQTRDGLAMANQPDAAHRVFPGNDHPSDKARFTFHVTAPRELTVVAGGRLKNKVRSGESTRWTYRVAHPMATELAQVSIGLSHVRRTKGPHGLPLRDVVPVRDREELRPWLEKTPRQMKWLERRLGPYPFETYGLLVADAQTGFELETQTLSLFEKQLFTVPSVPSWYKESVMVHELAHQWLGDSVTPETWDDLWLNEGHATWYEWLYGAERGGASLTSRARDAYKKSDDWRKRHGPPAKLHAVKTDTKTDIFRKSVYEGSAVALYALRQKIGDEDFRRLQREWITQHRDGNASTADFTRLANAVAKKDLTGFLKDWLYGEKTPPMPGHPDWRSS